MGRALEQINQQRLATLADMVPSLYFAADGPVDTVKVPLDLMSDFLGSVFSMAVNVKASSYQAKGDGLADDAQAILNAINDTLAAGGNTVFFPYSAAGYNILSTITPTIPGGWSGKLTLDLGNSTIRAGANMPLMLSFVNADNICVKRGRFDLNNKAMSGVRSFRSTAGSVKNLTFEELTGTGGVEDQTLFEACFLATGVDTTCTHQNVTFRGLRINDTLTSGAYIYYGVGVTFTDFRATDVLNHGASLNGCTDMLAYGINATRCGGSGFSIGLKSYHGTVFGVVLDQCFGDGGVSIENTSADIEVFGVTARNCWKPATGSNFLSAGPFPNDIARGITFSMVTGRAAAPVVITGATKAAYCKLTVPNHGIRTIILSNTVEVSISGIVGMTELNGNTYRVTTIDPVTHTHDPNALWLRSLTDVPVDSTGFGVYGNSGLVAPYTTGHNQYGGVPELSEACGISNSSFHGFNSGLTMSFMNGGFVENVDVWGLQGPESAVAKFVYFRGSVSVLRCDDATHQPTSSLGAIQFLNQPLGVNACTQVRAHDLYVLQCGTASDKPLVYVEGNGILEFTKLNSGGCSAVISTRAAVEAASIKVRNWSAQLTGAPFVNGAGNTTVFDTDGTSSTVALAYSAAMTPVATGWRQLIAPTNGVAFAINAALRPTVDQLLEFTIRNASGGALGAATWNAQYKMAAWVQPANGFSRTITFRYNGTNFVEISRTPADIPN